MQVIQGLPSISLSGNLIDLVLAAGAAEEISVDLYAGADRKMSELYKPDTNGRILIRYKKVIDRILKLNVPDSTTLVTSQGEACVDFTVKLSSTNGQVETLTFRVIKGEVSTDLLDTVTFLQTSFLTWQPTLKYVQYYDPEWLTYYSKDVCELKIKAFVYPSKTFATKTLANLPAGQLSSVNLNYGQLVTLFAADGIPSYYDVWIEKDGVRQTYVQRFILSQEEFDFNDVFVFENSVGGIDTIRFTGTAIHKPAFEFDNAWFDELNLDYEVRPDYVVEKNTGYFRSNDEKVWSADFFGSLQKYKNESGELAMIYTQDPDLASISGELAEYSFNYSYSNKTDAMNLKRPFEAPVALALPGDVVNTVVQLSPRINQYPWANTIDVLVPVQYAFESVWRKLSLKQALASLIITAPGTGGGSNSNPGILGDWQSLTNKHPSVNTEDLAIEFKTDAKASLTQAITFFAGQFFIDPSFVGTSITLGNIADGNRPLAKLIRYFITKNIEMFLIIEPNGDVKIESKDGFNLPTGTTDADKYFINQFYRPNKALQTSFSGKWVIDETATYCEPAQSTYIWGRIFEENTVTEGGATYANIVLKTFKGTSGAPPADLSEPIICTAAGIAITKYFPASGSSTTFSTSLIAENSKELTAPGSEVGNTKFPKQLIALGTQLAYFAFDGQGKETWKLLQTVAAEGNSGWQINPRLKWVSNDANEFPLDVNNELCSISGLPQKTMLNTTDNANYRISNPAACPVSSSGGGGTPAPFKNFIVEQYGRKFRISGPETIECDIIMTINYYVTVRDEDGNNPENFYGAITDLRLFAGDNESYSGSNLTAGLYDTLHIIDFSFTPKTCSETLIYVNGQSGQDLEEIS